MRHLHFVEMKELGVFDNPAYKITFWYPSLLYPPRCLTHHSLDRKAMVTVAPDEKVSIKSVFDTKGLAVIWGKCTVIR